MKQEFQDTNAYAPPLHFAPARASPEPPRAREQKSRPEAATKHVHSIGTARCA